ncbi:MAG: DUF362 domain-containing protein, partial [candidate division KSB1 bacterium]|nr:DUF362 domain-containing protein [candidate division KSB1 bacterium]
AAITEDRCIGCGQCFTVCRFDAVRHDWQTSSVELQKKMAEHALGAVIDKKDKVGYMNFLISITKDCDCLGKAQKPIFPDIGIIAARDGVALDTATLDLIKKYGGRPLSSLAYPHIDPTIQLHHAQEIGLGTMNYELIEI